MTKTCNHCGTVYGTDQRKQKYCSRQCFKIALYPVFAHVFDGKRGMYRVRGEARPGWKGDNATENTKRHRARRYHPLREFCDRCKVAKAKDRHHLDDDPGNNDAANIAHLCRRCHMLIDGRLYQKRLENRGKTLKQLAKENQ